MNHRDGWYKHNIRSKKCKKLRETLTAREAVVETSLVHAEKEEAEHDEEAVGDVWCWRQKWNIYYYNNIIINVLNSSK